MSKLFKDYIKRADVRLQALEFYLQRQAYADTVREAQEVVELLLKGLLRFIGVEAPKVHDVGKTLDEHLEYLPEVVKENLKKIKAISKRLRKERELSFYGSEDFIPSEEYDEEEAREAIEDARFVFLVIKGVIDAQQ